MILPHSVESIKTHKVQEKYNDEHHPGNRNGRSSELLTNHSASHGQVKYSRDKKCHPHSLLTDYLESTPCLLDVDEDTSGRSAEGEEVINKTVQKCQRPGYDTTVQTDVLSTVRSQLHDKSGCIRHKRQNTFWCPCPGLAVIKPI